LVPSRRRLTAAASSVPRLVRARRALRVVAPSSSILPPAFLDRPLKVVWPAALRVRPASSLLLQVHRAPSPSAATTWPLVPEVLPDRVFSALAHLPVPLVPLDQIFSSSVHPRLLPVLLVHLSLASADRPVPPHPLVLASLDSVRRAPPVLAVAQVSSASAQRARAPRGLRSSPSVRKLLQLDQRCSVRRPQQCRAVKRSAGAVGSVASIQANPLLGR